MFSSGYRKKQRRRIIQQLMMMSAALSPALRRMKSPRFFLFSVPNYSIPAQACQYLLNLFNLGLKKYNDESTAFILRRPLRNDIVPFV